MYRIRVMGSGAFLWIVLFWYLTGSDLSEMSQSESDFSLWKYSKFSASYSHRICSPKGLKIKFWLHCLLVIRPWIYKLTYLSLNFHITFVELIIVPISWVWILWHNKGDVLNLNAAIYGTQNVLFIYLVPDPIYQPSGKSLCCSQVVY